MGYSILKTLRVQVLVCEPIAARFISIVILSTHCIALHGMVPLPLAVDISNTMLTTRPMVSKRDAERAPSIVVEYTKGGVGHSSQPVKRSLESLCPHRQYIPT
jgi:hypothetical protein